MTEEFYILQLRFYQMLKGIFSFQGRIRRTEFGLSYLIGTIGIYSLVFVVNWFNINGPPLLIHLSAIYWFLFAQGAKRCHDLGKSGFFQLIPFYILALFFVEGEKRHNKYGGEPKLMEHQQKEAISAGKTQYLLFPKGKDLSAIGSELLSGILVTVLAAALISFFYGTIEWLHFIVQALFIIAGYYIILHFGFKKIAVPQSSNFFLLHRAVFSFGFYLCLWSFETYGNNVSNFTFSNLIGDISNIIAIFSLTYLPYLIFKTKQKPSPIHLEA